jgi:hypothetical protein
MQAELEETRICPDCGRTQPAHQPLCECGTAVLLTRDQEVPVRTTAVYIFDRVYLALSSCWILLCVADIVRFSSGLLNRGLVFSTPAILTLAAFLHGAIGVGSLLHEEWSKNLAASLCYLQIASAVGGGLFAFYYMGYDAIWVTQGYFAFLIVLSVCQLAVLGDSN